jgi:hypothetical protein
LDALQKAIPEMAVVGGPSPRFLGALLAQAMGQVTQLSREEFEAILAEYDVYSALDRLDARFREAINQLMAMVL